MPSGFITLPDGRCLARRWIYHDDVVRSVANMLSGMGQPLGKWLLGQLPGPNDIDELGYGAWLRQSDQTIVVRHIDTRNLTPANQRLFCEAAKLASNEQYHDKHLARCLLELGEMTRRFESGEPPLSLSDCREVMPHEPARIGPGWNDSGPFEPNN
jgi:hypothetical protein